MTMLPFKGRCHTCGHDHDAEDQRVRDVLEALASAPQASPPLTEEQIGKHTLLAGDCPPASEVLLVSSVRRLQAKAVAQASQPPQGASSLLPALVEALDALDASLDNNVSYERSEVYGAMARVKAALRPLLAASPPPATQEPAAWQPIETAPKDRAILLGNKHGSWIGKWVPVYQSGYVPDNPWQSLMLNHDHIGEKWHPPTHWQPLYAAPAPVSPDSSHSMSTVSKGGSHE